MLLAISIASGHQSKRTFAIGVITEEISNAYGGLVISGIEAFLSRHKHFFIIAAHRHDIHNLEQYVAFLLATGVEGVITIDTILKHHLAVPTVAVAGHRPLKGVTHITLDHTRAAHLALRHLFDLGHRQIAVLRGHPFSSDADDRWHCICDAARGLRIRLRPELAVPLDKDDPSPAWAVGLPNSYCREGASPRCSPITTSWPLAPSARSARLGCACLKISRSWALTTFARLPINSQ